jgi:hypothetical protein
MGLEMYGKCHFFGAFLSPLFQIFSGSLHHNNSAALKRNMYELAQTASMQKLVAQKYG